MTYENSILKKMAAILIPILSRLSINCTFQIHNNITKFYKNLPKIWGGKKFFYWVLCRMTTCKFTNNIQTYFSNINNTLWPYSGKTNKCTDLRKSKYVYFYFININPTNKCSFCKAKHSNEHKVSHWYDQPNYQSLWVDGIHNC